MATLVEVDAALRGVADKLAEVDPKVRGKYAVDRTVSCRIPDLDVVYAARLCDEGLQDVRALDGEGPRSRAQVRLRVSSDDLLALTDGRLAIPTAWATGRLRVEASVLDLLRLRTLL